MLSLKLSKAWLYKSLDRWPLHNFQLPNHFERRHLAASDCSISTECAHTTDISWQEPFGACAAAALTDLAGLGSGWRQNMKCLYFRVRSRTAGDGDRDGAVGYQGHSLRHRTGHWPSDHMIRSRPLISWPPKIVSKRLEEICFKDFGGNL